MLLLLWLVGAFCEVQMWRSLLHTLHSPFTPWLLLEWPAALYLTGLGLWCTWDLFTSPKLAKKDR